MQSTLEVKRLKNRPRHLKNWEPAAAAAPGVCSLGGKAREGQPSTPRTVGAVTPGPEPQQHVVTTTSTDVALTFLAVWLCTSSLGTSFTPDVH